MKFNSLVQNAPDGGELVGYLNGFTYAPDLNAGQFFSNKTTTRDIVYQLHSVQLTFNVLHTHLTGWVKTTSDTSTDGKKSKKYSFGSADDPEVEANYPRSGVITEGREIVIAPLLSEEFLGQYVQTGLPDLIEDQMARGDEVTG